MRNRGFTLVELMAAMGISLMVFATIFTTYLISQRLWRGGFSQITFQATGRIALDKMTKNLRPAIAPPKIMDDGNKVRFTLDPNRTPENATDDVTCEYYISGTNIMYDPNIGIGGNETTLLRNVYQESTIPFFQFSGNLIIITFKVYNSDAVYGGHWAGMTTSICMRNLT